MTFTLVDIVLRGSTFLVLYPKVFQDVFELNPGELGCY